VTERQSGPVHDAQTAGPGSESNSETTDFPHADKPQTEWLEEASGGRGRLIATILDHIDEARKNLKSIPINHQDLTEIKRYFSRIREHAVGNDLSGLAEFAGFGESLMGKLAASEIEFNSDVEDYFGLLCYRIRHYFEQFSPADTDTSEWKTKLESLVTEGGEIKTGVAPGDALSAYPENDQEFQSFKSMGMLYSEELRQIFVHELREHTANLKESYEALLGEGDENNISSYQETLLRTVHTLAGNCRNVNLDSLAICVETVEPIVHAPALFQTFAQSQDKWFEQTIDLLARSADVIEESGGLSERLQREAQTLSRSLMEITAQPAVSDRAGQMTDDDADIRQIFMAESQTILSRINDSLSGWRSDGVDDQILAALRREFHTLKGSAAATGFDDISGLSHSIESLLDESRVSVRDDDSSLLNLLEEAHDGLAAELGFIPAGSEDHVKSLK